VSRLSCLQCFAHCCSSCAIVSTTKSFDALALPPRVPTTSFSSYLPHHPNAFLISTSTTSSPHAHQATVVVRLSPAATVPRQRLYIYLSLHLFSFLLLSTSHPIQASSTCILSTLFQPTTNQPTSHTTLLPFSIHNANMKSNYNMLALAAAAVQANAMPSNHLW
jgi:hypothetical protein